jgi:hypothetical protein|tara:strand:- start:268 stop:462 length:195 start_codon:yes stop_codon:yes gene_type:complete
MAKKYFSMNEVPVGTFMLVKETGEKVELVEIHNFPTTFKTKNEAGLEKEYYTYEVDILDWPPKE